MTTYKRLALKATPTTKGRSDLPSNLRPRVQLHVSGTRAYLSYERGAAPLTLALVNGRFETPKV